MLKQVSLAIALLLVIVVAIHPHDGKRHHGRRSPHWSRPAPPRFEKDSSELEESNEYRRPCDEKNKSEEEGYHHPHPSRPQGHRRPGPHGGYHSRPDSNEMSFEEEEYRRPHPHGGHRPRPDSNESSFEEEGERHPFRPRPCPSNETEIEESNENGKNATSLVEELTTQIAVTQETSEK